MDSLPTDTKIMVLSELPDLESLGSAVLTCKSLYSAYTSYPQSLLRGILKKELGPNNFAIAIDAYLMDRLVLERPIKRTVEQLRKFFTTALIRRTRLNECLDCEIDYVSFAKMQGRLRKMMRRSLVNMQAYAGSVFSSSMFKELMSWSDPKRDAMIYHCYWIWRLLLAVDAAILRAGYSFGSYNHFDHPLKKFLAGTWELRGSALFVVREVRYASTIMRTEDLVRYYGHPGLDRYGTEFWEYEDPRSPFKDIFKCDTRSTPRDFRWSFFAHTMRVLL